MEKLFRGINIPRMIKIRQRFPRETNADVPAIVPTMGSHGGATGEGQAEILAELGITEESTERPLFLVWKLFKKDY
ncbi:hypothetical protein RGU73_12790 [Neobacillus cucumis]|nr:hypothetical protein [Neobacillus cucumis]MDR4947266.1 hypothetical protein [Neobacillus cucumis]